MGGFSAPGGVAVKRRLLAIEDARVDGPPDLFDAPSTLAAEPRRLAGVVNVRTQVARRAVAIGAVSASAGVLIDVSGRS